VNFSILSAEPEADKQKVQKQAQAFALSVCLRTYLGVPDLDFYIISFETSEEADEKHA
jgi:hypothetical protein